MSTTPQAAPRPIGSIANVVGVVAALAWIVPVPAICYPIPLALGAIAVLLAFVANSSEDNFPAVAFFAGLVGIGAGLDGYQQYAEAMDLLNSINGLGL